MMPAKSVALLTSGGDAPGMNAAIRAATLVAHAAGWRVYGVQHGYVGLRAGAFVPLAPTDVHGIVREGGTVLGSARCPEFLTREGRDTARRALAAEGIEHLLVIGGNGSLAGLHALSAPEELGSQRLLVVGVPASIDNDVGLTGLSIGVDTAMNTIVEACDKIADTASAHGRTFIVEVMGRDSGYLAMTTGIATGADLVLFRESGRTEDDVVDAVVRTIEGARLRAVPPKRVLIIKAEGVAITTERLKARVDERLSANTEAGLLKETRVSVLGHIVRGGRPSALDRLLGSRLGFVAVKALLAGQTRLMAAWHTAGPPPPGVRVSASDPHCSLADLGAVLEETRRLTGGDSPLVRWRTHVFAEIEDILRS